MLVGRGGDNVCGQAGLDVGGEGTGRQAIMFVRSFV